jgi:phage terminase, large subunit, PBSX family
MIQKVQIPLPEMIGHGYGKFWKFRGRYRVLKGSRASKKSKTTALDIIFKMMKYDGSNTLVVRKTYRTLHDSCFTDLKWATRRLHVDHLWDFKESPLEATYMPTGQKILFRGLDDPIKVTSITVDYGILCWGWIEEAYEILNESDFDTLDESIRGQIPEEFPYLWKQWTLTFNPWNEHHWLKSRFFDHDDPEVLAITTNYLCNEWLDANDLKVFNDMKTRNPRRYRTAGLGDWGIVDGLIYENWKEEKFTLEDIRKTHPHLVTLAGLDFGYTNDPSAYLIGFLDAESKDLWIWDEMYQTGLSNRKIYETILSMGYIKEKVTADCAEPKSIDELWNYGMHIKGSLKGKDSIANGIQFIQDLTIHVHTRCVNFETEISNYTWDTDKFGKKLNVPIDDFNHLMDALRYMLEQFIRGSHYNSNVKGGI